MDLKDSVVKTTNSEALGNYLSTAVALQQGVQYVVGLNVKETSLSVKISGRVFFPYAQHTWEVPSSMRLFRITTKFQNGKTSVKANCGQQRAPIPKGSYPNEDCSG